MNEEVLEAILREELKKYHKEWEDKKEVIFQNIGKLRSLAKKDHITEEDIKRIHDDAIGQLKSLTGIEILWTWGGKGAKIEEFLNRQDLKNLLSKAESIEKVDDAEKLQELLIRVVKGKHTKLSTVSSWLCVMNPRVFYPMHARTLPKQLREKVGLKRIWGNDTSKKSVEEYIKFLKILERINQKLGITTMLEAAFYLSKLPKDNTDKTKNYNARIIGKVPVNCYLEVTKPPGKPYLENHVGRFLWSPADKRYWNGREGKIGMLEIGDIIIHDVKGKIVGYSKVAEKPKVVSKEEIIKLFNEEGIWSEKYSEFAKDWFKKSPNGKFYLVKLRDFQILPKKFGYTKLSSLPHPASIQGVYLTKINPKVLEELGIIHEITNNKSQGIQLSEYLISRGYLYPPHLVSQFYTALKTKGFVILSGLTGTGKTKIAQELAELLDDSKKNLLFLPVRPDWRDSKALLGYYNPLTGEYQRTQLLDFILKAIEDYDKNCENAMPHFVILDEMNLAHVEYYFADFLSVLESGRDKDDGFTKESIKLHEVEKVEKEQEIPRELRLPPNLYIIGTVNMDETTYSFSPKVLDRAFVVEFHDVDLENYPPQNSDSEMSQNAIDADALKNSILTDLRGEENKFLARSKEEANKAVRALRGTEYWKVLVELNGALEPYDMHFGYRVVDEIALFFQSAKESQDKGIVEFRDDDEIFDLALLMKVLPKFHGNRKKLEEPLKAILKLCLSENAKTRVQDLGREAVLSILENWEKEKENFRFKHTARKVLRMLRQLYEIGFASFS